MSTPKQCRVFTTFANVFYNQDIPIVEKLILLDEMMPGIEQVIRDQAIYELQVNPTDDPNPEPLLKSILEAQLSGYIHAGLESMCGINQVGSGHSIPSQSNVDKMIDDLQNVTKLDELGAFKAKWEKKYSDLGKHYFNELYNITGQKNRSPTFQESIYAMENVLQNYNEQHYNAPTARLGRQLTKKATTLKKSMTSLRPKSTQSLASSSASASTSALSRRSPLRFAPSESTSTSEYMALGSQPGSESAEADFKKSLQELEKTFKNRHL